LYDDVLYRDIAVRYHIEEVRALKELAFYLMSNLAGLVSFNKLKEQLRLGSVNTVKNYFDYLENSWLIFTLKEKSITTCSPLAMKLISTCPRRAS
jgi:predicted AAA+ superfamily ATPase